MRPLVALLFLLPAVAACGGSKHAAAPAGNPVDAVRNAAKRTAGAGSEALKLKVDVQTGGQAVVLSGGGAVDTKDRRGTLRLDLNAGPIAGSIDEVLVGRAAYLRSPLLSGALPGGKSWVKVDVAKLRIPGVGSAFLVQDPAAELKLLQAIRSATAVGSEQIGGAPAMHYRARLDAARLPSEARLPSASYDVWVGSDGYIRRVQVQASKPSISLRVDLSDFGAKVSATAPPASQVYESTTGSIPGLGR